jgi:hypothetical protein
MIADIMHWSSLFFGSKMPDNNSTPQYSSTEILPDIMSNPIISLQMSNNNNSQLKKNLLSFELKTIYQTCYRGLVFQDIPHKQQVMLCIGIQFLFFCPRC